MSRKKIITILSVPSTAREGLYRCPDDEARTVKGVYTNDAPVSYLLERHPDVAEVLCVLTPGAWKGWRSKLEPAEGEEAAQWASLASRPYPPANAAGDDMAFWTGFVKRLNGLRKGAPAPVPCVMVDFDDQEERFEEHLLSRLTQRLEPGDEVLLDFTGGFRNAAVYNMLMTRALGCIGVRTLEVIYSEQTGAGGTGEDGLPVVGRLKHMKMIFDLMDLIVGMEELANTGSVRTLRRYYETQGRPDGAIRELLSSADALWDTISMCRAELSADFGEKLAAFNRALSNAASSADPLFVTLLPAFRNKFKNGEMTVADVVEWCVNSDMLQQAITIYTEKIPAERILPLQWKMEATQDGRYRRIRKEPFTYGNKNRNFKYPEPRPDDDLTVLKLDPVKWETYWSDYRQRTSNCFEVGEYEDLCATYYLKDFLWLAQRLPDTAGVPRLSDNSTGAEVNIQTVDHLPALLGNNRCPYALNNCDMTRLQTVCRDYLYIKAVRNMTNHATSRLTTDQRTLNEWLAGIDPDRYPPLKDIKSEQVRNILLKALETLKNQ